MEIAPTFICPKCKQKMVIAGTKCPHCGFNFTAEMVGNLIVSCPNCHSDNIKIVLKDSTGAGYGITVTDCKYIGLLEIAQGAANANLDMYFECKSCILKFETSSFLLQEKK